MTAGVDVPPGRAGPDGAMLGTADPPGWATSHPPTFRPAASASPAWDIAVVGLGYVGLPVAAAFARVGLRTVGFDTDPTRVVELRCGFDRTLELPGPDVTQPTLFYTADPAPMRHAGVFVVTVPTPLTEAKQPDLGPLLHAAEAVGRALRRGAMVVFESTVYPGVTEEECIPVLERASGLTAGRDFDVAYSPERMNPGDHSRPLGAIRKVVSAQSPRALERVAALYATVVPAGLHRAPSIRVAEAAKVVENAQRDLNIAFVNELALMFDRMGLDTRDVLAAASSKWNFQPFSPGLVGGHCIAVDPSYLAHRAERAGYYPGLILAGRQLNDGMGAFVARRCVRMLMEQPARSAVVLGATFKENVPDLRNSPVTALIGELRAHDVDVQVVEPLAEPGAVLRATGVAPTLACTVRPAKAVILAVAHAAFVEAGWPLAQRLLQDGSGAVLDVKGVLDRAAKPEGVELWRL